MYRHREASTSPRPSVDGNRAGGLTLDEGVLRRVTLVSVAVMVVLTVGHVLFLLAPSAQVLTILDLGREQSVGTWVTSSVHLVCAGLSAVAALLARREGDRWAGSWWLLAAAFLVLSADETAAGHDRLTPLLQERIPTSGVLLYSWVLIVGFLGLCFLLLQVRFLRSLPRPTGRHLVMAGVVFVVGAVGLEMAEGVVMSPGGVGFESLSFRALIMTEELMELGAILWAVRILLGYLLTARRGGWVLLGEDRPARGAEDAAAVGGR